MAAESGVLVFAARRGCQTSSGTKLRYGTKTEAERAVLRRMAEGVRHDGRPWRRLAIYECRRCGGWHFTSHAIRRMPNFAGSGWVRDGCLMDTIELGDRVSSLMRQENTGLRRIAGLKAVARKRRQMAPSSQTETVQLRTESDHLPAEGS